MVMTPKNCFLNIIRGSTSNDKNVISNGSENASKKMIRIVPDVINSIVPMSIIVNTLN